MFSASQEEVGVEGNKRGVQERLVYGWNNDTQRGWMDVLPVGITMVMMKELKLKR